MYKLRFMLIMWMLPLVMPAQWLEGQQMSLPRYGHAAVVLDGYIYVIGGSTNGGVILNSVDRYDISTGQWDPDIIAPLEKPLLDAAAFVLDGLIYVVGGLGSIGEVEDDAYKYTPGNNTWSEAEDLHKKRRGHSVAEMNGTHVVLAGTAGEDGLIDEIEYFDRLEDGWVDLDEPVVQRRVLPFVASSGQFIYMFGGLGTNFPTSTGHIAEVSAGWLFDWQPGPSLSIERGAGTTALVGDSIFIMAGVTLQNAATSLVEIYDILDNAISPGPALPAPLIGPASVVVNDSIYVIGGYSSDPGQPTAAMHILGNAAVGIIDTDRPIPEAFVHVTGYPNPFNGKATIGLSLDRTLDGKLSVYDISGQLVKTLHEGRLSSGNHQFQWAALSDQQRGIGSGLYFVVFRSGSVLKTIKLIYTR